MSDEYTPTTEDVKMLFSVYGVTGLDDIPTVHEAEAMFDRWLRDHDAKVLEDAADAEADWTSDAWRSEEAETVVKLRKGLRRRAAALRVGANHTREEH